MIAAPAARPRLEALDARILHSADPIGGLGAGVALPAIEQDRHETALAEAVETRREIVFVDAGVEDAGRLIDDFAAQAVAGRDLTVVTIGADQDGLARIGAALREEQGIAAVHVIAHGADGFLRLGNLHVDQDLLLQRAEEVAAWSAALTPDADLLLYGCDLAAGDAGRALARDLAALTGADVAASDDPTGTAERGGDWTLEYVVGTVETGLVVTDGAQAGWIGLLLSGTDPSPSGTALYGQNGQSFAMQNPWDGLAFGVGEQAAALGNWRMIESASAPVRDETIAVGVDASGSIRAQMRDAAGVWSEVSLGPLGTVSVTNRASFAVAYEQQSADAMLVWTDASQAAGSELQYAVWDGATWSGRGAIAGMGTAQPQHMRIAAQSGGDGLVLVVSDANADDRAVVWDGSAWGNAILLDASGTGAADQTAIAAAWEGQSGDALVAYGKNNSAEVFYRVWDGAAWSGEASVGFGAGLLSEVRWLSVAADPGSDRIVLGTLTSATLGTATDLAVWSGSAWGSIVSTSTLLDGVDAPSVAVAFEADSGQALAAYGKLDSLVHYRTWTSGGGWSGSVAGPDLGANPNTLAMWSAPSGDAIMLGVQNDDRDVHFLHWSGSGWASSTAVTLNTGQTLNQPFSFAWDRYPDTHAGGSLWLSPSGDAVAPGWTGVNGISGGEVLAFGGAGLSLGAGATEGSFSHGFDIAAFALDGDAELDAVHYVTRPVALPGLQLQAGDVLFSTGHAETLSGTNTLAVTPDELVLFRPAAAGSFSTGTFALVLDNFGALTGSADLHAVTLVEIDTPVGEATLAAGTLLFGSSLASGQGDVFRFVPVSVGAGATAGTVDVLLEGDDVGIGHAIAGLGIVVSATTVGGAALAAGDLAVTLDGGGAVGANALAVSRGDVFVLHIARTSLGGATAVASASMLLRGADVGVDEKLDGFALIAAPNAAPVLDPGGTPALPAVAEDDAGSAGMSVAAMLASAAGGDPISDADTGALEGIAVVGVDDAHGTWQYSVDGGGAWLAFGAAADTAATLLDTGALLRFVPQADWNGTATIAFRAWDRTSGNVGQTAVDVSNNGETTAWSTAVETASVAVTPVNDAPILGLNAGITVLQGDAATIGASRLAASDVDHAAADLTYTLTVLPDYGVLRLDGVDLGLVGATFTQADIDAGRLRYVHDNSPVADDRFGFVVVDAAGEGAGAAQSFDIRVSLVNQAPSITANTLTIEEGGSAAPVLTATDPDSLASQLVFTVSAVSGGRFELNGQPGVALTSFTQAQVDAAHVRFVHDGGEAAPAYAVSVSDGLDADGPMAASVTFVPVDDAPVRGDASVNVVEGGSAVLIATATDADDVATDLVYTVSGLAGGRFELAAAPGVAVTAFTQAQVDAAEVIFVHDGGEQVPAFALALGDGTTSLGPQAGTVFFTAVNDAPVIQAAGLSVTEGETVVLDETHLLAGDPDHGAGSLRWTVETVTGGRFELLSAPGVAVLEFTQAQVGAREVAFVHDGGEAAPAFAVRLSDGLDDAGPVAGTVVFTPVDDAPAFGGATIAVAEGGSAVLAATATDPDDAAAALAWSVAAVSGGYFAQAAVPAVAIAGFTQAQVDAGEIVFVHDGGEAAPSFSLGLSDGSTTLAPVSGTVVFTPVNDAPSFAGASIDVAEGGTAVLAASAADPDHTAAELAYTVTSVAGGYFAHASATGVEVTAFTQAQVDAGVIVFVHDGGEAAPAFSLGLTDGTAILQPAAGGVVFHPTNDAPAIAAAGLALTEGGSVVLGDADLRASDSDDAAAALVWQVETLAGGRFEWVAAPGVAVAQFTQAQVAAGAVRFVHDGGDGAPVIGLRVTDASGAHAQASLAVAFTAVDDAPTLVLAMPPMTAGESATINRQMLNAVDSDTAAEALVISVQAVDGGRFELADAPGVAATHFTQADIDAGRVRFAADGAATGGSVRFAVSDAATTVGPFEATFAVVPPAAVTAPQAVATAPDASGAPTDTAVKSSAPPAAPQSTVPAEVPAASATAAASAAAPGEDPASPVLATDAVRTGSGPGGGGGGGGGGSAATASPGVAVVRRLDGGAETPAPALLLQVRLMLAARAELLDVASDDAGGAYRDREALTALDEVRRRLEQDEGHRETTIASAVAAGTGLSLAYVAWLMRGGVLLGSVLTSLPAWRMVDPLPVLQDFRKAPAARDDEADDAAERLFADRRRTAPQPAPPTTGPEAKS